MEKDIIIQHNNDCLLQNRCLMDKNSIMTDTSDSYQGHKLNGNELTCESTDTTNMLQKHHFCDSDVETNSGDNNAFDLSTKDFITCKTDLNASKFKPEFFDAHMIHDQTVNTESKPDKIASYVSGTNVESKTCENNQGLVFVTCTRADFSKMTPLIFESLNTNFPVTIWVSGMHLQEEFGSTFHEIYKKFSSTRAKIVLKSNQAVSMSQTFVNTSEKFNRWLNSSTDMVFVHGDRIESLACATIAVLKNVKVCHIEGGELSGTIDESLRHAITKLSHIHLVSNESSRVRLLQLGEHDERIHVVGSPEVDAWLNNTIPFSEVKSHYNIAFEDRDYMVLLFHPVTINFDKFEIKHIVDCCIASKFNFVVIKCNNDTNYETIVKEYTRFEQNPHFRCLPSMRFEYFISLLKHSNGLVGNSSVGVRETPILGIPSLNIGSRQQNRSTEATSVIHIPDFRDMTVASLEKMKDMPHLKPVIEFGRSGCAERFGEILRGLDLKALDIQKYFVDM